VVVEGGCDLGIGRGRVVGGLGVIITGRQIWKGHVYVQVEGRESKLLLLGRSLMSHDLTRSGGFLKRFLVVYEVNFCCHAAT
jgi:hypothetical protein